MRRLRVGILDLIVNRPARGPYPRFIVPNLASIAPQAVAVWCEADGHHVQLHCYTGVEDLRTIFASELDLLFVGAFSPAAQLAYALSAFHRSRRTITAIGGPHARCYPEDAALYFDYVLGFTDRSIVRDVLAECAPHRPVGRILSAARQPSQLPGVRERWPFIRATTGRARLLKVVPMLSSLGCPYSCSFCIDSTIPYQAEEPEQIRDDLRFLAARMRRPRVAWHDPNFGVRFEEIVGTLEEAVPPGRIQHIAESSLSLLTESRLQRLQRVGFRALLPGIESWYDFGSKTRTRQVVGLAKVLQMAEHVNLLLRYVPYVQTNFVLGLDCDEGDEPFELTRQFLALAPGAFPAFSLFTAFGRAAPLNLTLQREGRVVPFPHHFLDNNKVMNVRPRHYEWAPFYARVTELHREAFGGPALVRRLRANRDPQVRAINVLRGWSREWHGRARHFHIVRRLLEHDRPTREFFEGASTVLPRYFQETVRRDLGALWRWLPAGALDHDPAMYAKSEAAAVRALAGSTPVG